MAYVADICSFREGAYHDEIYYPPRLMTFLDKHFALYICEKCHAMVAAQCLFSWTILEPFIITAKRQTKDTHVRKESFVFATHNYQKC